MRIPRTIALYSLIAVVFFGFGSLTPAIAGNFGFTSKGYFCSETPTTEPDVWEDPCNNTNLGNNYTHTAEIVGVRSDLASALRSSMSSDYDPTDLQVFERSPADVIVMDNSYGKNGYVGWVVCPDGATTGGFGNDTWCYGQELRFNLSYPGSMDTVTERAHLACHEFGHTVGLRHEGGGLPSCMKSGDYSQTNLTDHDRSHINEKYLPY